MIGSKWILWATMVASFAPPLAAQEFVGARALGMAGAYRAVASGNDAIYLNPAGLKLIPRVSPEMHYSFNLEREDHQLDFSFVDSRTGPWAAGIAYSANGRELSRRTTLQHTATVAIAWPILPEFFTLGAGFKYLNISDAIVGNYLNALSADVAGLVTIPGGIQVALVGYNLVPIKSDDAPVSMAAAMAWDLGPLSAVLFGGYPGVSRAPTASGLPRPPRIGRPIGPLDGLTLTLDWEIEFLRFAGPSHQVSFGTEWLLFDAFPIRAGYVWNERVSDQKIAIGAGFIVPYFGLDAAWQQSIVDANERIFAVSLKFFLQ